MKQLRSYQTAAVNRGVVENCYYAFDPGLGKTVTAIETGKRLHGSEPGLTLVVLAPKAALEQWQEAIYDQAPGHEVVCVRELHDVMYILNHMKRNKRIWIVTHYPKLVHMLEWFEQHHYDMIVADEAHNMRNPSSDRTLAMQSLKATRKIAMSGTPMDKSPAELWPMLHWFEPKRFTSFWAFANTYVQKIPTFGDNVKWGGAKPEMLVELGGILREYMIRVPRKVAAPEMPPLLHMDVPLLMEPKQWSVYQRIRDAEDIIVSLDPDTDNEILISNVITQITRLQQVASDPELLDVKAPSVKLEWIKGYVENNPNEQMLIFTRFRATTIKLAKMLKAAMVVGGQPTHMLPEFRAGKVQCLVGTISAMGTALDFPTIRIAHFVDAEYSSILMTQAQDRHYRIGLHEREQKIVSHLITRYSIDSVIELAYKSKFSKQELVYKYLELEGESANGQDTTSIIQDTTT